MQRRRGCDVGDLGILDAHFRAERQAQVADPAHRADSVESRQLERHRVHAAKPPGMKKRGRVMRFLVDLHRHPGGIPHRSAVLERGTGLFQHHVEAGDGAPDPRRVEP